jgi:hypothetical protein
MVSYHEDVLTLFQAAIMRSGGRKSPRRMLDPQNGQVQGAAEDVHHLSIVPGPPPHALGSHPHLRRPSALQQPRDPRFCGIFLNLLSAPVYNTLVLPTVCSMRNRGGCSGKPPQGGSICRPSGV